MDSIDFETAISIAEKYISTLESKMELTLLVNDTLTERFGWVFFYNSKKFVETGDFRFMAGGNAPIIVNRYTGIVFITGTSEPIEYYINEYKRKTKQRS